jgi:transposase
MPTARRLDPKVQALQETGTLNRRPERVTDELFHTDEFFNARDLLQVKYEMLRRVDVDRQPVSRAAAAFGFSRLSFYQARTALAQGGLAGLVPRKRGPRQGHKLNADVVAFLLQARNADPAIRPAALADRVAERFGVRVHPRSIERALARQGKKRR